MKALHIEIYSHDNEVEVAHKINTMELHNWINHLTYVKKEINNLIGFYKGQSDQKKPEKERLINRFEIIKIDNEVILSELQKLNNNKGTIPECEDTHCDMSFIQEHEKCRRMFLFHIDKYRKLKDSFFNELQTKMTTNKVAV